jgi:putative ABC transport system permease protein
MDELKHDLRTAIRVLRNRPGFTLIATLTLALGIGANTTVFSVIDAVLLKSIPFPDPDRLVAVWETVPARDMQEAELSFPNFRDYAEGTGAFEGMAAFFARPNQDVNLTGGLVPERTNVARVTWTYFDVLGVEPSLGRAFTEEEDRVGNHRVAILSHGLWTRQFGSDPAMVGKTVGVNGFPYVVVGIMPAGFRTVGSMALGEEVDLWRPLAASDDQQQSREWRDLRVIGRLRTGIDIPTAQRELLSVSDRIRAEDPEAQRGRGVNVVTLQEQSVGSVRQSLLLVWGAVGLVLLIACANVANLLLVKASGRGREISIRASMGATRGRLVRQLLTESVLLAGLGGLAGVALSWIGVDLVIALAGDQTPLLDRAQVDLRALTFTLGIAGATGVLFGLVPAIYASRSDLTQAIKQSGSSHPGGGWSVMRGFIVTQLALAMLLLTGSGLLIRSFTTLRSVDPGFKAEGLLTLQMELPMVTKYPQQEERSLFFSELRTRIGQIPGVMAVANADAVPMGDHSNLMTFSVQGRPEGDPSRLPEASVRFVSPEYFTTMGIPLLRGRGIETTDGPDAPGIITINETLSASFFGDEDPIGYLFDVPGAGAATVVGVVGDVRTGGLAAVIRPEIYFAADQIPYNFMTTIVRTRGEARSVLPAVRAEVAALDPEIPLHNVRTVDELLARNVGREAFTARLLTGFAALALLLAAVGTYGVMASAVDRRKKELGIRVALGARPIDGFLMVTKEGLTLIGSGVTIGLTLAVVASGALKSILYQVSPLDLRVYALTAAVLASVALGTVMLTAARAAKADPVEPLKAE